MVFNEHTRQSSEAHRLKAKSPSLANFKPVLEFHVPKGQVQLLVLGSETLRARPLVTKSPRWLNYKPILASLDLGFLSPSKARNPDIQKLGTRTDKLLHQFNIRHAMALAPLLVILK